MNFGDIDAQRTLVDSQAPRGIDLDFGIESSFNFGPETGVSSVELSTLAADLEAQRKGIAVSYVDESLHLFIDFWL